MATVQGGTGARLMPLKLKAQRFWRWWTSELLAFVPERFSALAGGGRVPLVAFEDGGVTLLDPRVEGKEPEQVQVDALEPAQAAALVRAMLERAGEIRSRTRLALSPRESLLRRVTMPAATEENLATVLGFEMDRLTPFRAEDVYYDHRVIARDPVTGTLTVLLAVARRDVVETRLAQARQLGVNVQGVEVREDARKGGPALDVLPRAERGEGEKPRERYVKQGFAAAVVVLFLIALALPIYRKNREVHEIRPALDKAIGDAQATDALIRELERLAGDHNFLLTRRHATYPTLAYVEEVTRLLPDNTWLQQFEIKQAGKVREVLMSGETVSSSRLIEILEQSKLLQNASPRGTVTRGTQPGTERFVIAAEIRPKPQPEAVSVTENQPAVALAPSYAPPQSALAPGAPPK